MPETARNIDFDETGKCLACQRADRKIDRQDRIKQLSELCDKYRRSDCQYDCIIPVSGGKDSFFQVYWMKFRMNMNPLLLSVTDNFEHTKAGEHNAKQIAKAFRCDMLTLALNPEMVRETTRWGFENIGSTNWAVDMAIYAWPLKMAIKLGIPLVIYGENVEWEYGCKTGEDTYSALGQICNNVVNTMVVPPVCPSEMNCLDYPTPEEIVESKLNPIYLSYFTGWDGLVNMELAKRYGFKGLDGEWARDGYIDGFWQIDSVGYLMNYYLKFAKYGYSKATDVASHLIRCNHITRENVVELVRRKDGCLDQKILDDFLRVTGYSAHDFWNIMDKWFNPELFERAGNTWKLRHEHRL
jgi:N-acetyl sugar amidotransferase